MASALDTMTKFYALPESMVGAQPMPDDVGSNFLDPNSPLAPYQLPLDPGFDPRGGRSPVSPAAVDPWTLPNFDPGINPSAGRGAGSHPPNKKSAAFAALQTILATGTPVARQTIRDLHGIATSPDGPQLATAPAPAMPGYVDDNGQPLPNVPSDTTPGDPSLLNTDAPYPTLKKTEPTLGMKVFGLLSALSGGPGAQIVGQYLQQKKVENAADYARALDQRQTQRAEDRQDTQDQQKQDQQQQENDYSHAQAAQGLLKTLSGYDADTQQHVIESIINNPQTAATYGMTPDQVHAQFYDKDGNFQPVGSAEDAKSAATTLRAQTDALKNLHALTPAAQQATHDSMNPSDFESEFGVPFDGFTPGQIQRDSTIAGTAKARAATSLAGVQTKALQALVGMSPAMQATIKGGMSGADFQQKYGLPPAAFKPGMKESDALRLQSINNAETDAQRRDATTRQGQDLTHEDRQASLQQRRSEYQSLNQYRAQKLAQDAGKGGKVDGLKLSQIVADRAKARGELQRLRTETEAIRGSSSLTDDQKQRLFPDIAAQTQQAQSDYNQLDALYQQRMAPVSLQGIVHVTVNQNLPHSGSAAPHGTVVTPAGSGPLPVTAIRPLVVFRQQVGHAPNIPPQPSHPSQPPNASPRTQASGGRPRGNNVPSTIAVKSSTGRVWKVSF